MAWLSPKAPHYDPMQWAAWPLHRRAREACVAWARDGYGAPLAVYGFYLLKMGLYVGGWLALCALTPELGNPSQFDQWWAHPIAFQKAIVWSLLFEVLGLGCGSGPLTGRYWPPVAGFLHFLRPGTLKLPFLEGSRWLGGTRRAWVDVLGFAALCYALGRAALAPAPAMPEFWPIVALLALMGLRDRTIFLAARAEHYWVTVAIFAFAPSTEAWIAGAKVVQLALWFWAGVSKLNAHFPTVIGVMVSNSPFTPFAWMRRRMYRDAPRDLSPSRLAVMLAHGGAALEFGVPILLGVTALGLGGPGWLTAGMVAMVFLHVYITSNVPAGVPLEWNVMVVYGGAMLFAGHSEVTLGALEPWPLTLFVVVNALVIPLAGNLWPARFSFLPSMRYYAGNWANSVWLFREESYERLDRGLKKSSPWIFDQLGRFYDASQVLAIASKVMAFRLMHLHGRVYSELVPQAMDPEARFVWVDGEIVAGLALGWNFGDGHLHDERLLAAIQARCGFEPGELRCVFVESQPLGGSSLSWRIADAAEGELARGEVEVASLIGRDPWPAPPAAVASSLDEAGEASPTTRA